MEILTSFLVGKPLNILAISLLFVFGHWLLQFKRIGSGHHPRALLTAAWAWMLYAAWEWLVRVRTPEANIRADLLLIWPVLLIVSIWFTTRAFR